MQVIVTHKILYASISFNPSKVKPNLVDILVQVEIMKINLLLKNKKSYLQKSISKAVQVRLKSLFIHLLKNLVLLMIKFKLFQERDCKLLLNRLKIMI